MCLILYSLYKNKLFYTINVFISRINKFSFFELRILFFNFIKGKINFLFYKLLHIYLQPNLTYNKFLF